MAEEKAFNARLGGAATEGDFVGHMQAMKLPPSPQDRRGLAGKPALRQAARGNHGRELGPDWVTEHLGDLTILDGRSAEEFDGPDGRIAGSLNVPLALLQQADLPSGPLEHGYGHPVTDLEGGLPSWQQAGLPVRKLTNAPMPLMRQVQIAAGSLVLLGLILSNTVAPAWILLSWFVGAGLVFAGVSGFCGMARLLALMPWNRVSV